MADITAIVATYSYMEMDVEVSRTIDDMGGIVWTFEKVGNNYEKKFLCEWTFEKVDELSETVPTREEVYEKIVLEHLGE